MVRNAYVVTMDAERAIYPQGAVAVSDGQIVAVGREHDILEEYTGKQTLDARGAPVHPGFIETHVHITQHNFRFAFTGGLNWAAVLDFFYNGWLPSLRQKKSMPPACWHALRWFAMARLRSLRATRSSTVTPQPRLWRQLGLAMSGDPWVMDMGPVLPGRIPETTDEAISLLGSQLKRNASPNALVQGHVSVIGHGSTSDELLKGLAAKECADKHGVILNQHQSYGADDTFADDDKRGGHHVLRHFADLGLLDTNCTFAHMNLVREDEIDPVVRSGMSVAWCPTASMIYGMGGAISGRHLAGTLPTGR